MLGRSFFTKNDLVTKQNGPHREGEAVRYCNTTFAQAVEFEKEVPL